MNRLQGVLKGIDELGLSRLLTLESSSDLGVQKRNTGFPQKQRSVSAKALYKFDQRGGFRNH